VCDQTPIWAQSFPITQDGTFITDPVTLDVPGYYTYKESLAAGDFVMPFETTCAETAETAIVRGHPAIETKVSATAIRPGDELSDTAVVTGLGELDAPVKVELWGPYDSRDDIDCEGAPFATQEFTATGDGEYVTEPVEIARAGFYTYREAIVATDAYDGVQTKCGEAAETSFVQAEPEITTIASDDVVRPGGQLHDRIRISGLGETPARVEVELHGPFQTRAAMDCSGRPAKSQTLRVDGDGVVKSEPVTVAKAGFYTYRERIEAAPGIKAVRTECGVEAETALGRPLILTGRGDDVRDVYGDAAQGDERPAPTQVRYSRLGIQAPVSPIGIDLDSGALGISKNIDKVGWWRDGGAPNDETGATLLAGHVDSAVRGAGAFFALKDARRGDTVRLDVAGGQSKGYRVVKIQRLKKENLPAKVFSRKGPKRLVLVTCGGPFMPDVGHYRDNIIVTAVPR
jgi:hypothetical protein